MPFTFRAPQTIIDQVVARMKAAGVVHPDAAFNPSAEGGFRREVTYRDYDFLDRLEGTRVEADVVDAALGLLKQCGLAPADADYDRQAFEQYRHEIANTFTNPYKGPLKNPVLTGTTVTPMMQRLLYVLTSVHRPRHLIELGSFWGNTLAWFAGPCIGTRPVYDSERIIGIDRDVKMTEVARANFARLPNARKVELIAEDACMALDRLAGPFDALYLEAKDSGPRGHEVHYLGLLKQVYDRLPAGAWVLAHDATHCALRSQMRDYLAFVRDKTHFRESICFDVDWYGLEVSIK